MNLLGNSLTRLFDSSRSWNRKAVRSAESTIGGDLNPTTKMLVVLAVDIHLELLLMLNSVVNLKQSNRLMSYVKLEGKESREPSDTTEILEFISELEIARATHGADPATNKS